MTHSDHSKKLKIGSKESEKRRTLSFNSCFISFSLLFASSVYSDDSQSLPTALENKEAALLTSSAVISAERETPAAASVSDAIARGPLVEAAHPADQGYTINYDTVSIIEYIRFASKICNINFIFNEADLNFTVTVVSDAPITTQNVMGTLVQVLRIHGLSLLEQDNNLVIHKSPEVMQLATLMTDKNEAINAPIVTRIFRLKEAKADAIAGVIRPMISSSALLEVLAETRQIILTDVTVNVQKVAALVEILDSPINQLGVRAYTALHNTPEHLVELVSQIMSPIAQGSPFILVPQPMANAIYIVSTGELIDKTVAILTSLDISPKQDILTQRRLKGENIFVYKALNRSSDEILSGLFHIAENLQKAGIPEGDLIHTMDSARSIKEANSITFVGSKDSLAKVKEFLSVLDVQGREALSGKNSFFVYRPKNRSAKEIDVSLKEMADNLKGAKEADQNLIHLLSSAKINKTTNTILFSGDENQFGRIKDLIASVDIPTGKKSPEAVKNDFFLYKIQHASYEDLQLSLKNFAKNLDKSNVQDEGLTQTIEAMKPISETNSILFSGPDSALSRLKELVPSFDSGIASMPVSNQFLVYKPKNQKGDQLAKSVQEVANDLKSEKFRDPAFLRTLESMKYVRSNDSLLLTGDAVSLKRLEDLIATIDLPTGITPAEKIIWLYPPKAASREKTETYLKQLSSNLDKVSESDLIDAIHSMKWIDASHSFLFQGTSSAISRLKELIQNFDQQSQSQKNFFLYPLEHAPIDKANQYFDQLAESLSKKGGNLDLVEAIRSRKWIADSHSFLFQGSDSSLSRIKEILQSYDVLSAAPPQKTFFLYKLQSAQGEMVEEELDVLAKDLKKSGLKDDKALSVIQNIRFIKETNSLLLTGDPAGIEEVKAMIANYDYPRTSANQISSNFFMYKPQHQSSAQIEKSLLDIAKNLKEAGLADPPLLKTIDSAKYVAATNSLIFTGNAESIQKIQSLLKEIDVPSTDHSLIQHIGKTSFLLYKLKIAGGPQIVTSLKTMTSDLKKSGGDADLIHALSSVKYVKETNSLFFTGAEKALEQVQSVVEQFDVPSLASTPPQPEKAPQPGQTNFFLYKPVSLSATDLETLIYDFSENLRSSGLTDPDLFSAIASMRTVEKTQSIVFTGTPKALDQIKTLLTAFDIPSNLPNRPNAGPLEPSIQAIDNTSFLVYKLQFHKGDEIQNALKQIAKDLLGTTSPVNQNLLNSIHSIQWLDVTNSLLCSGDQETLSRLKELIKNLDIPLKQVFIEILVIETSLTNALLFGLEWGGNYKFNDKFGISSFNTTPPPNAQIPFPDQFVSKLSGLTPPNQPTPIGNIPPVAGFDLGVIGEVIKHNGNTFLTLGSLLSALQSNIETTIITAPKILGQDGRTSTIFSGANIPFTGSFVNNTTNGATILTSNIEYRDIGLNLTITPVLGNSDIVTLDINLDRSQTATDVAGQSQLNFQSQTANGIITSKTTMQTTVHVPDRNFLVLSGFVNNSNTKTKQGMPCLGGLPMIGAAFSQQNDTISNQNVVIFLRPFIINSIDDMRRVTSEQENFFRDLSSTPFLEHNFDDSMELIKSIDDE